jgi:hypothetical protein
MPIAGSAFQAEAAGPDSASPPHRPCRSYRNRPAAAAVPSCVYSLNGWWIAHRQPPVTAECSRSGSRNRPPTERVSSDPGSGPRQSGVAAAATVRSKSAQGSGRGRVAATTTGSPAWYAGPDCEASAGEACGASSASVGPSSAYKLGDDSSAAFTRLSTSRSVARAAPHRTTSAAPSAIACPTFFIDHLQRRPTTT